MRISFILKSLLMGLILPFGTLLNAQGFMHQDGKNIVDGKGNNFLIRSIGTGNWMLQEGYMMQSTDAGLNTQWQFREKLIETIGQFKTDSFYNVWLGNHFTRADVDSMKAWGFNSIRPALHYKLFTPPIEDEPIAGQITWFDKGFEMTDSLIKWCTANEMYLILDMHGTPGGQGMDMAISDYNPAKDALWENQVNKDKLVALWKKLADRYKNEPYVGGYDLINETNWAFAESGNKPLWDLHKAITAAIREVDSNHLIIIEGNWFANDFSGIPTLWDKNMALSFHKYWTYNDENSLDWMISLRDQKNVPIWLGESGENSNSWFTQLISLAESNNIGWSWWPVKKGGINNVLEVKVNEDYTNLIKNWDTGSPIMTDDEAFQAVLTFAKNHNIKNCLINYDVIDAMIRQPFSNDSKPYKTHTLGTEIFFVDYDLGRNKIAYTDTDTADYHGNTDVFTNWNAGGTYRNDGVDIQTCTDTEQSNGYNVGWTSDNEWLQYSLACDSIAAYTLKIRHASGGGGSKIHIENNNVNISGTLALPGTGDWQNWQTATFNDLIIPAGSIKIKIVFDQGGSNLNYFNFTNPKPINDIDFVFISAETSSDGSEIYIDLNKETTTSDAEILSSDFELMVNLASVNIASITKQGSSTFLIIKPEVPLYFDNDITLSYNGISVKSGSQNLLPFLNKQVKNNLPHSHLVPGKIQAEDFSYNNGLVFETCTDAGAGQNSGYAAAGDYLDYRVHVTKADTYKVNYRVATTASNAQLIFKVGNDDNFTALDTIKFISTGGWQTWKTQSSEVTLQEGYYTIRLLVKQGEHNLNWFEFGELTSIDEESDLHRNFSIFPNPTSDLVTIKIIDTANDIKTISIFNITGSVLYEIKGSETQFLINTSEYPSGIYFIQIQDCMGMYFQKLLVK